MLKIIKPDWVVPSAVKAFTTTVDGGVSRGNYADLNLGEHVEDNPCAVTENRARLQAFAGEAIQLCWLQQTHGDGIVDLAHYHPAVEADAAVTTAKNKACIVMTADCLPVLLCRADGSKVAALHCGWKGLYNDLIAKTLRKHFTADTVTVWLGPAIGKHSYEVDTRLYRHFSAKNSAYSAAFTANRPGHYLLDLTALARRQLAACGVSASMIYGGGFDTLTDRRFFSYRRRATTGRMATVIYRV